MKSKKILVIDDDQTLCEMVSKALINAGHEVVTADNMRDAIEKIDKENLKLIISDVMLPHLGGFELVDQIKSDPSLSKIPVLIMTGMDRDILQMTNSSADAIITKPFSTQQLIDEVEKHLQPINA